MGDTKIARSNWQARDELEIDIRVGDKLYFYAVESGWVLGSIIKENSTTEVKGWFPLDVLLSVERSPSACLEVMSLKSKIQEISDSIIENKKRFALRLEHFLKNRVSDIELIKGEILLDRFSGSFCILYKDFQCPILYFILLN